MTESTKENAKTGKRRVQRPIPHHNLESALSVPKAIEKANKGKALSPVLVAKEMKIKPSSSRFRNFTSSSFKYGLTTGDWNADKISLTPLGSSLVKPTDKQEEMKSRQQAILSVDVFKKVYDQFKNKQLPSPEDTYFRNTLETQFGIPRDLLDECIGFLRQNGTYAGILTDVHGSLYVTFEGTPPEIEEVAEGQLSPVVVPPTIPPPIVSEKPTQIFVIHGKNKVPLEQLKKILSMFKIPHKVAIDEPHVGRPISQKVAELMNQCTSAIVIFTADEEYTDKDAKTVFRPSDNAVYELGAASILYGNKIVILREETVELASDFKDLGYITFEKDKLDAKAMDLIKEFVEFGLLSFTPA